MSNKLIEQMTESINFKLKDIERYTKMINLVVSKDVKGIRKFIYDNDTCEKEMFFELLDYGDNQLFHRVYPSAEVGPNREYAVSIIHKQYKDDRDAEAKWGIDFTNGYPEDWSDEQYPDKEEDPWETGKDLSTHSDYKYL